MTSPDIVALDTRDADNKAAFLATCARDLHFPDYFGGNWDAFEECLRDLPERPTLIVWTGAAGLPDEVRETALQIFGDSLPDGVDVLVVDDVTASAAPDFALDHVQLAIPPGAEDQARAFWVDVVGLQEVAKPAALATRGGLWLTGDALNLHLGIADGFRPATKAHPGIMVSAYDALLTRLQAAEIPVADATDIPGVQRCHTTDPFGNRIEFIAF